MSPAPPDPRSAALLASLPDTARPAHVAHGPFRFPPTAAIRERATTPAAHRVRDAPSSPRERCAAVLAAHPVTPAYRPRTGITRKASAARGRPTPRMRSETTKAKLPKRL